MIKTKEQLRFYLQEDAKANKITSVWKYYKDLILSNNNAQVYRYLKVSFITMPHTIFTIG